MIEEKAVKRSRKIKRVLYKQETAEFVKKQSILGSFLSVQTLLIIVIVIIDLIQANQGRKYYKALLEEMSENRIENDAQLLVEVKTMVTVRYWVLAIQAIIVIITWLGQWITDVYLITLPLSYIAFAGIIIAMWKWADPRWHGWNLDETDNEAVSDA